MVRDVLRLPASYAFYAYADIAGERTRLRAPLSLDEAFLIFRIINALQPTYVAVIARGPVERFLGSIARLAVPGIKIVHRPASRAGAMTLALDPPGEPLPEGTHAYLSGAAMEAIPTEMPAGHIYRNPARAVIAALPHLPFQTFDIRF